LSTKPELGVKSFNIDGFMHNGAPVDMRASAWLNVPKGMDQDPAASQALNQVRQLMMDHGISVRIQLQHRAGEDPKTWPRIASFPLFPEQAATAAGVSAARVSSSSTFLSTSACVSASAK
jgi:hypothetical protein